MTENENTAELPADRPAAEPAVKKPARKRASRAAGTRGEGEASPVVDTRGGASAAPAPAAPADVPVHVAWAAVQAEVTAIAKGERNRDVGFAFRGIDAVMNAVGPIVRKHGVFVLPAGVEIQTDEKYATKSGTTMHGLITRHNWLIYGPRGDSIPMQTLGEASDAGDKVASKAASVAYRTALLQSLMIPTGDRDPDADAHERGAARSPDPRDEGWRSIAARGHKLGLSADEIRADYASKNDGRAIDGADTTVEHLRAYYDSMASPPPETPPTTADVLVQADAPADPGSSDSGQQAPADDDNQAGVRELDTPAGEDRRVKLWGEIADKGAAASWDRPRIGADFTAWAAITLPTNTTDDGGRDVATYRIDGPETTNEHLVRYLHAMDERTKP